MSPFYELDSYFDKLKHIERSENQKQKTLNNILYSKKKEHKRAGFLAGSVTMLFAIIAVFLLVTALEGKEEPTTTSIPIEVNEVSVAKSVSATSFKAYSSSPLNTVQLDDHIFYKELETFLKQLTPLTATPTYQDHSFDMAIKQADGSQLQMKIWENNGEIILYDLTEKKYYMSTSKNATNVYRMLKNIPFP